METTVIYLWALTVLSSVDIAHQFAGIVPFPKNNYRLNYETLNRIMFSEGNSSRPLYEVYVNRIFENPPLLRKVVVQWHRDSEGAYTNTYAGWFPDFDTCISDSLGFTLIPGKLMKFEFLDQIPGGNVNLGTIFTSHPDRYIINWYCLESELVGEKYCRNDTRITIASFDPRPNHLPWHLISADLCKNNMPMMDDQRWTMTWENQQCDLPVNRRKKRETMSEEMDITKTMAEEIRNLWP